MLRSIYSGITGMRINQVWFDVIAENMANVNTPGFKKSRISFEDLLNHTLKPAMQPVGALGGINPMQIGLGARVSLIQVIHTPGAVKETNVQTDLLINGEGYFIISDGSPINKYTRAGNFTFDTAGNLISQGNGFRILGWNAERNPITGELLIRDNKTIIDTTKPLEGIVIKEKDMMNPRETTTMLFEKSINASTPIAFEDIKLNFTKYIESVVPATKPGIERINLSAPWAAAGFENTPTGSIELGPVGDTQTFEITSTPQELMNQINTSGIGITIKYENNRFILMTDPNNERIREANGRIILSEKPQPGKTGFFTEAKIPTGEYNTFVPFTIKFDHLLDPEEADNYYLRWRAIDASNNLITTNAYYYVHNDYGIPPGNVTDELVGYSDGETLVFELDNADVDPNSLQIYVEDPKTGKKILYEQYKLPWKGDADGEELQKGYLAPKACYYFDDNGQTEVIYPLAVIGGVEVGGPPIHIGKSKNGVDRIIFIKHLDLSTTPPTSKVGAPPAGYKITAGYGRNGFNMSESTIDPATLEIKIDGVLQDEASYIFNDNIGIGGKDQITLFSTISEREVVEDHLNILKPFKEAGFNCAPDRVMQDLPAPAVDPLSSTITISWDTKSWTSRKLEEYETVQRFLSEVNTEVNKLAGKEIIYLSYDPGSDKFRLENQVAIRIRQDHRDGFLTHAKLPGEGETIDILIPAFANRESREEVVKNSLDTTQIFIKAGFNNGFLKADPTILPGAPEATFITFKWKGPAGQNCEWKSRELHTYGSIDEFIMDVNQAVDQVAGTGLPLRLTMRYDPKTDRFTIVNYDPSLTVSQNHSDGFLTKAKLLTAGTGDVPIPMSRTEEDKIITASYHYNKTVEARGILQLDKDYKVINNFKDTEVAAQITSSVEVISGPRTVNTHGDWAQFDSGTINGTITIETDSGIYVSKEINTTNYRRVLDLLNEINASDARVLIQYDPTTDKFTLKSLTEGARITLKETGTTPFFSEINFTLGTVQGGNNNGVMDLPRERPTLENGWTETTGPAGTGRDFFRVNIKPNEIKNEILGAAGSGKRGTQVMKAVLDGDPITPGIQPIPGFPAPPAPPEITLTLPHADVDKDTLAVYYSLVAPPLPPNATECVLIPSAQIRFLDNTGPGGRDQIVITQVGGSPPPNRYIHVDYTRLNAFDLKYPDVDETTIILKVNEVIQDAFEYTFQDNKGLNGVDRIILERSYGTGTVEIDYRQTSPLSSDVFIPNGNRGPEKITFTPNTMVDTTYYGNQTSDLGLPVTAKISNDYIVSVSKTVYDALGKAWDLTYKFEKLSTNRWLWSVLNPADPEKFAGYGIAIFDEEGKYDKEESRIFESPSDERLLGTRFKGVFFDPEGKGGAPPLQILPDFTKLHQLARDGKIGASWSDVKIPFQDGYPKGELESRTINAEGIILGKYTNGQVQSLGQIALAKFTNPSGLLKNSATLFIETLNSGEAEIKPPGKDGMGSISSGQLEISNVDLVEEFTDLIISQRAFQANSRIIITDDQILTEIVNMKR